MDIQQVKADLRRHEGLRLHVYQCTAGANTIGYGHNIDAAFSQEHAEALLDVDLKNVLVEVQSFPGYHKLDTDDRKNVIINMLFNLGQTRLSGFKKMWAAIDEGDYQKAAAEMRDSLWAKQVGVRAVELSHTMEMGFREDL